MNALPAERSVYVIEFTSGTVKVGQAGNPVARLAKHDAEARRHGHCILRSWVSPPHVEYGINESSLIEFCAERWPRSSGREYFASADFDEIATHAGSLRFERLVSAVAGRPAAPNSTCKILQNGATIRALRSKDGYKPMAFASAIGISASALSHIEAGRKSASSELLNRMARTLYVPVAAITLNPRSDRELLAG